MCQIADKAVVHHVIMRNLPIWRIVSNICITSIWRKLCRLHTYLFIHFKSNSLHCLHNNNTLDLDWVSMYWMSVQVLDFLPSFGPQMALNFENNAVLYWLETTFNPPAQCKPSTRKLIMLFTKYRLGFNASDVGASLRLSSPDGSDHDIWLFKRNHTWWSKRIEVNIVFIFKL